MNYERLGGLMLGAALLTFGWPSWGRPVPDATLGDENSQVIDRSAGNFEIGGGARRQANLFHSFREFGVENGGSVYFLNPSGVENIFGRVTGANRSEILGTLGVRGSANLFLLNPNGILFGSNARLDLGGSFTATTANAIQFGEESFSATRPEAPSGLLTINPSAFLFDQISGGTIDNRAANNTLTVATGENILLLGGDISIDNGRLFAKGGRIELAGVSQPGLVGLNADGSLNFSDRIAGGNVSLSNAELNVSGANGSIIINAGNITILNGRLLSGIENVEASRAGDIILRASEGIEIGNKSTIQNIVTSNGLGNSGNIDVSAHSLTITNGSEINSSATGNGDSGQTSIFTNGRFLLDSGSRILGGIAPEATGNSQGIEIRSGELRLDRDAQISSSVLGRGNSGRLIIYPSRLIITGGSRLNADVNSSGRGTSGGILIQSSGRVIFDGSGSASSSVLTEGIGRSGGIRITARSLRQRGESKLDTTTSGTGNSQSGSVVIRTQEQTSIVGSKISSGVSRQASGDGGDISIHARSISIRGDSELNSSSSGDSRSQPGSISLEANAQILIEASQIFTSVSPNVETDGGNVHIASRSLAITKGSKLNASTSGGGDSGQVMITSEQVDLSGGSAIRSGVNQQASGNGGGIQISADSLAIAGAELEANTFGSGDAGNVRIQSRAVSLSNRGSISARTGRFASGEGGNISIKADELDLAGNSAISALSQGTGRAGNISLGTADRPITDLRSENSDIRTTSGQSAGGAINLSAETVRLRGDSDIQTLVQQGSGGGGNITINADSLIAYNDSDVIAAAKQGQGGNINFGDTIAFFEDYNPNAADADPATLANNNHADINATGATPGIISVADTSTILNALADLPNSAIDTEALLANSCIARTENGGTFLITGSGGLPANRPGTAPLSPYPTDTVRSIPDRPWQPGDPIVEPQGVYRLPDGELVMMHECSSN